MSTSSSSIGRRVPGQLAAPAYGALADAAQGGRARADVHDVDRRWRAYLGVGTVACAIYAALPGGLSRDVLYPAIAVSSALAIMCGVRAHSPPRSTAWYLMALGILLWAAGDVAYFLVVDAAPDGVPVPTAADALYLLAYLPIAAGLLVLLRARRAGVDAAGFVDSVIVTASLALVSWVVVAGPIIRADDVGLATRLVDFAYPATDILLLALLTRLVTAPGARTVSFRMLTAAVGLLLVGDSAYAVLGESLGWDTGPVEPVWLASYVLWGACALHPSMTGLTTATAQPPPPFGTRRLVLLTVAVLLAPTTLAAQVLLGRQPDLWPGVLACVTLFGLVMTRLTLAIHEITTSQAQRDRLARDLAREAAHDPLTGLANRARTLEQIDAAISRAQRSGAIVALLFVDLDHFKRVNDTQGHCAGDAVLTECARRMRRHVRAGDTVGRLGGDEFVVLVESANAQAGVLTLAERLLHELSEPVRMSSCTVAVTASIGVAVSRDARTDAGALLSDADAASYRAKAAGRGRVEVFDSSLRTELAERTRMEADMRTALERGEFVLRFRRLIDVPTGSVRGVEALVHWDRPGSGVQDGEPWLPVAEQSGLTCDIGRWALREAAQRLRAVREQSPQAADLTVAVGVSGTQLVGTTIVQDVTRALTEARLPPTSLVLEVSESAVAGDAIAGERLRSLRALGVSVSVDDFGTGYASFGPELRAYADTLKIDRRRFAATAPGGPELLLQLVRAAQAFGLSVVTDDGEARVPESSPVL
jgi:diguanylate cyclase (GGDEF)-like protein